MDRSSLYNNAGVRMFDLGCSNVALDLFRGALESRLEKRSFIKQNEGDADTSPCRCVTPDPTDCVTRAESVLMNLNSFVSQVSSESEEDEAAGDRSEESLTSQVKLPSTEATRDSQFYPYLYEEPFLIPPSYESFMRLKSVIIVFNLGLIHHVSNRTSPKTAFFYEIAAYLLGTEMEQEDDKTLLLRVALLNNCSIWNYENGNEGEAQFCMEQLSGAIAQAVENGTASKFLPRKVLSGLHGNIESLQWSAAPEGSPSA